MPRALELHEIPAIIEDFRKGAQSTGTRVIPCR
jgi:hypothetical protein